MIYLTSQCYSTHRTNRKICYFPQSQAMPSSPYNSLTFFSDVRKTADLLPRLLPNLIVDKFGVSSLLSHLSDWSLPSDICHLLVDTFLLLFTLFSFVHFFLVNFFLFLGAEQSLSPSNIIKHVEASLALLRI